MNRFYAQTCGSLVMIGACVVLALVLVSPSATSFAAASFAAQDKQEKPEKKITSVAGVANTKMGAYEALAELSYQLFERGDYGTAATLARILERTWDAAEDGGGEHSLSKTNRALFDEADKAMDVFIKPVINHGPTPPDTAAVYAAYKDFLGKLKQADQ